MDISADGYVRAETSIMLLMGLEDECIDELKLEPCKMLEVMLCGSYVNQVP